MMIINDGNIEIVMVVMEGCYKLRITDDCTEAAVKLSNGMVTNPGLAWRIITPEKTMPP